MLFLPETISPWSFLFLMSNIIIPSLFRHIHGKTWWHKFNYQPKQHSIPFRVHPRTIHSTNSTHSFHISIRIYFCIVLQSSTLYQLFRSHPSVCVFVTIMLCMCENVLVSAYLMVVHTWDMAWSVGGILRIVVVFNGLFSISSVYFEIVICCDRYYIQVSSLNTCVPSCDMSITLWVYNFHNQNHMVSNVIVVLVPCELSVCL